MRHIQVFGREPKRCMMLPTSACVAALALSACQPAPLSTPDASRPRAQAPQPTSLSPVIDGMLPTPAHYAAPRVIDLTREGDVVRWTASAEVLDTRLWPANQPGAMDVPLDQVRRVRNFLPPHQPAPLPAGVARTPPQGDVVQQQGGMLDDVRTHPRDLWPGIGQTAWVPPDPSIAVGPNHVVMTVNQSIAFYTKAGVQQFSAILGSQGSPGFFEPQGAGTFAFDPKCFYDHLAQRFVVVALEVYDAPQSAWITIGVSDDSDPNGVWYKYRTDAVINVSGVTYWWDYPGFGYDSSAWYVTGNLFGLSQGGWAGVGYRVLDKTPMLTGQPAVFSTLRDGSSASVQVAQHFGTNQAPFFVSTASSTSLRIQAIRNPLTAPVLSTTSVTIPAYAGAAGAPTPANTVGIIDPRILNACWVNGQLYATHSVGVGSRALARWYQVATNTWPTSGTPTLVQSGDVDPGLNLHSFFPAIYANNAGEVGIVVGVSGPQRLPSVAIAARSSTDPTGRMSLPQIVKLGEVDSGGRWGDYYDMAIDPTANGTFWIVGQYPRSSGWANWVSSFTLGNVALVQAFPDDLGPVVANVPRTIDVLANDYHRANQPIIISTFQTTSVRGGSIVRSVGTGPGGRDQLFYTPPSGVQGADSFTYTAADASNNATTAAVTMQVFDPNQYRPAENVASQGVGLNASYYALSAPQVLPNFASLTPYLQGTVTTLNFASTGGNFANSNRADDVGAVFRGFVQVPSDNVYTFFTESDDGSRLWIGSQLVVDNDGLHGMQERGGAIGLRAGRHSLRVEFFEGGGGAGLIARLQPLGGTKAVMTNLVRGRACDDIDFNNDGIDNDPTDIEAFLSVYSGGPCIPSGTTCQDIDFNNDGIENDPTDIEVFLSVYSGGPCT